ncbi:hypothetical protein AXG93_4908s1100 [Marchantia polymorpha subsp. ruderalis]|uniref:DEAD/DEAH-box helicase domain-containing protein n=1 Tax=Marchantia polymorpha subsp. ruderalis TaxID=1480154 RepID=A0A176WBG4_MARPO|nr:hypothetical protein AXG93_4908s1100 [Marchantia polymorpha subsp. ruderalis]
MPTSSPSLKTDSVEEIVQDQLKLEEEEAGCQSGEKVTASVKCGDVEEIDLANSDICKRESLSDSIEDDESRLEAEGGKGGNIVEEKEAGELVLVSAHASGGKTVVAEYAIAMSLRDKKLVVYISPIKALSDQKLQELVYNSSNCEPEVFSSCKEQLDFGLQVVVTMFTGFAFGYSVSRLQFRDIPVIQAAGPTGAAGRMANSPTLV